MSGDCIPCTTEAGGSSFKFSINDVVNSFGHRLHMTKKYVSYEVSRKDRAGNIVRGFVLGLAEIGCFGRRLYDLDGYPYDSEAEALRSDWQTVGNGLWSVISDSSPSTEDHDDRRQSETEASQPTDAKTRR